MNYTEIVSQIISKIDAELPNKPVTKTESTCAYSSSYLVSVVKFGWFKSARVSVDITDEKQPISCSLHHFSNVYRIDIPPDVQKSWRSHMTKQYVQNYDDEAQTSLQKRLKFLQKFI